MIWVCFETHQKNCYDLAAFCSNRLPLACVVRPNVFLLLGLHELCMLQVLASSSAVYMIISNGETGYD
jgi:hypothetical protein